MQRSRLFQFLFGLGISLTLLLWIYYTVDWDEVGFHLQGAQFWALVPSVLIILVHFILRAWRWHYLLSVDDQTKLQHRYDSLMVGNLATFVLPLRAGEFVRPFMLSKIAAPNFIRSFVSVVLERFFDLSTILILFAVLVIKMPNLDPWVYKGAYSLSALALGILCFILIGGGWPDRVRSFSQFCLAIFPERLGERLLKLIDDLLVGAGVLHDIRRIAMVILLSVLVWGSALLQHYLFFYFLQLEPTWWLALSVMVVIALAVAAPSAPGFIGVYQAGWIGGLAIFGVEREIAIAYSLVAHIFTFLMVVLLGMIALFKYGLRLGQLIERPN